MNTVTLSLDYAKTLTAVLCWVAALWVGSRISSECRTIRAEWLATGEGVEPLDAAMDRLDVLHAELFGEE